MTILDASGALALLRGEPGKPAVQSLLRQGGVTLTATGLIEVLDHLVRLLGVAERDVVLDLADLGLHDPPPLTAAEGKTAGLLRAKHYHRVARPVSLADCVMAAVSHMTERPLATSDPALLDLCHEEGIATIPLPASDGTVWSPG